MSIDAARHQRQVPLEALHNVRDLGGYTGRAGQTLRWQRLYRGDDLAAATGHDLATLADLGIRTIIDLRSDREVAARPTPTLPGTNPAIHHLPLRRDQWQPRPVGAASGDPIEIAVDRSIDLMVEGAPAIIDALAIMASPSAYPIIFHSSLGQDRVGVLTAVVLGLLAVRDETIVEDFALSSVLLAGRGDQAVGGRAAHLSPGNGAARDWAGGDRRWVDQVGVDQVGVDQVGVDQVGADREVMVRLLERIRTRARSMVGFARSICVPFETVEALHDNLLS